MDAKLFSPVGPLNAKKILSPKINSLDCIKLHGVHGNPSGTEARSKACPFHLKADPRSTLACHTIFSGFFPYSTNSRRANCQLMAKQNGH